jgi:hypothetical protein
VLRTHCPSANTVILALPLVNVFTAKAPQLMWIEDSAWDHSPPVDVPMQNAPQPFWEASVSITRSGLPETRAFPFQASRLSLPHQLLFGLCGQLEGVFVHMTPELCFCIPVSGGSVGKLERQPG